MNARHDRRTRGAALALEPLEGRALLTTGGTITHIATLPATIAAGPMKVAADRRAWFVEEGNTAVPTLGAQSGTGQRTDVALPPGDAGYAITSVAADAVGNVWYALAATGAAAPGSAAGKVGKVGPGGVVTEYALPSTAEVPGSTTVGPDGNVYVAVSGGPAGPAIVGVNGDGSVTEMAVKGASGPLTWLTKGPDGDLWFVDGTKVGKMTMAGAVTEYTLPAPQSNGKVDLSNAQLTAGPGGSLWFLGLGGISKITTAGAVTTIGSGASTITSLAAGTDGNLWLALVPPAGTDLAIRPGEVVLRLKADGETTALPDHVEGGLNVGQMAAGDGLIWLNEGGKALSLVNVASLPSITPAIIKPTTPHTVMTDARKTVAGPLVSFTATYPGALASDFTAKVDYGDGFVGNGAVVSDGNGGFVVLGYNTYKLAVGTQVKVKVDVTGKGGAMDEIYGVVQIAAPAPVKAHAAPVKAHAAPVKAHAAPVKAHAAPAPKVSHPTGPAAKAVKK